MNFTGTDAKEDTVEAVLVVMQLVLARKSVKYIIILKPLLTALVEYFLKEN